MDSRMGSTKEYELRCRQQPVRARMCGFGEKDRRPLDPPPVVQCWQLLRRDENEKHLSDLTLAVHASLWNDSATEQRDLIANEYLSTSPANSPTQSNDLSTLHTRLTRVLMGSSVASPVALKDDFGEEGLFFVFPDVSIRTEGRFRLRFTLLGIAFPEQSTDLPTGQWLGECFSDVFIVYSAKKFPGMLQSTSLTKAFAKQGLKIPVRSDNRHRQEDETDSLEATSSAVSRNSLGSSADHELQATSMSQKAATTLPFSKGKCRQ